MSGKDDIPSGFHDLEEVEAPFEVRDVVIKQLPTDPVDKYYKAHEELGSGKFGRVVRCEEVGSGRTLACKYIDLNMSKVGDILNEISIMQKLQHPRLLQLYDAFQEPTRMILILEFPTGGELFYRVVNTEYSERTCKFYLIQLCEALRFMHSNSIIHLDLKPENILLVNPQSNKIKVIDFGLAREQKAGESLKVLWGTAEFVAPEVINYEEISTKTDMWSVGVITYILLSGISPFMGDNMGETYGNVVNVRYDFEDESFDTCSPEAKLFIQDH